MENSYWSASIWSLNWIFVCLNYQGTDVTCYRKSSSLQLDYKVCQVRDRWPFLYLLPLIPNISHSELRKHWNDLNALHFIHIAKVTSFMNHKRGDIIQLERHQGKHNYGHLRKCVGFTFKEYESIKRFIFWFGGSTLVNFRCKFTSLFLFLLRWWRRRKWDDWKHASH